ncbi:ankyrin repeat domain-containing protein [Streptomycetaceae bacterium NBC_01309]
MEKLFRAVRHGDTAVVTALLDKNPALVAAVRKPPPKKDAGQQPLGVALKTGKYDIARLLLDRGADVNFIEAPDIDNRQPVVNDAVEAAVASALGRNPAVGAESLAVLRLMLGRGADVTAPHPDTGRPVLWWAVFRVKYRRWAALSADDTARLTPVFQALVEAGADADATGEWTTFHAGSGEVASRERTNVRAYLTGQLTGNAGEPARGLLAILDSVG